MLLRYILKRIVWMVPFLVAVSVVALFNTTIGFAGAALLIFAVYSLSAGQKASCVGQGLSGRP